MADALEHNISFFSYKMALANQKAGALEMLLLSLYQINIFYLFFVKIISFLKIFSSYCFPFLKVRKTA